MELGFIDSDAYNVDACIWMGHPGEAGIVGVGTILTGHTFKNGAASGYEQVVQFPFGYGLSYSTFTEEITASDIKLEPHGANMMPYADQTPDGKSASSFTDPLWDHVYYVVEGEAQDGPGEPGSGQYKGGTWFPCAVTIAATWNTGLARAEGVAYAPAMNMHRSPFGGRNFEHYSEDGVIAGQIGGNGIMGSLNRIGMTWFHYGMYVTMLRDEWGWKGFLITDGDGSAGDAYNNPQMGSLPSCWAMKSRRPSGTAPRRWG